MTSAGAAAARGYRPIEPGEPLLIDKSEKKLDTFFGPCYSADNFVVDNDRSSAWGMLRMTVINASVERNGFERG